MTRATMDIRRTAPGTAPGTVLANPDFDPVEVAITPPTTSGFLSRPHVLEAASACFEELGYDGLTIRAIACRLGCSVGSIYRYFTDKRELLLACASQVLEPVAEALERDHITFVASVAFYVRQARAMGEQYRLMFWLCDMPATPGMLPVIRRILEAWTGLLGDETMARDRWAQLHGMLVIGENATRIGEVMGEAAPVTQAAPDVIERPLTLPLSQGEREPEAPELPEAEDVTLL
ncbi:MAG: TetR/AcrR family transcriptional regulator [Phycisphaerales bacterium]